MKKPIKIIAALILLSALFTSCTKTDSDEDLQLYQRQELFADDTGGGENPPPPPPPPPGYENAEK